MNKTLKIWTIVSIFSLVFLGSSAFAEGWQQAEVEGTHHPMGWETFEASWLIGHTVYSPLGRELGQIEDLMIDRTDGHIALVILSGVQGFGAEFVAAPFSALERRGENIFQLNLGDQDLSIPSTSSEDPYAYQLYIHRGIVELSTIPSSIDSLWADSVYRFYGQPPYWTEGETAAPDIMSYRTARSSVLQSLFMEKSAPVLMGATVQSENGEVSARVNDLVIDSKEGRVAFLVLDRVPGKGDLQVAVPFGELSTSGNALVLNTTGDRLASTPSFDENEDMNNLEWAESVYRFFGQQPYWTTEGRTQ